MTTKQKLTAEHFYKFFQCPHWLWYDLYEDQQKKKGVPPLMNMIYEDGLKHEKNVMQSRKFDELPAGASQDLDESFLATVELMKKGRNIYHGVLMDEHWVGIPDLLEARPMSELGMSGARSKFGDHYYVVYDVKSGKELRDEYKFQLVFYSLILERIQGVRPKEAFIVNGDGEERSFLIDDFLDYFHLTRETIEKILDGEKPPPFLKSGCKRTPWYSLCVSEAESCRDVSLIYRLSQMDQKELYNVGIKTIDDFANTSMETLQSKLEGWNFDKLIRFHNQAQSLVRDEPLILKHPAFPKVKTEIYFDIESDPTQNIDYLLGILVKNTETDKTEYKDFFANDKSEEEKIWKEFIEFLDKQDDFVIYHYAFYERQVFDRLYLRYGAPSEVVEKFKNNTIDLHRSVVDTVILPLYFYSLKDVARYIGFQWKAADAGGAESVVWYNDWKEKGDKNIKQKIIDYNKDDVMATLIIKEWLEKQKPKSQREILPE
ncbi:MAG: TM0106 family RecB-like putative nuclease [bacterium]|nr:TM0106 family RecB-like putative nuclease [bacterium]